jgi:hypothetical protein
MKPPASITAQSSTRFASLALLLGSSLFGAERSPEARPDSPFVITTSTAPGGRGTMVKISTPKPSSNRYQAYEIGDGDVTFDLSGAHIAGSPEHPMRNPVIIGEQDRPPKSIRIIGGVVGSAIPNEWGWFLSHAFSGAGFYTVASGLQSIEGARVHNVEDGWHPRETPGFKIRAYPNTGRFLMRGCYMTQIRDDCIENDEFLPGDIEDSLFDGVWTLFSEQNERQSGVMRKVVTTIGPNENPNINLTRVLVRCTSTCGNEPKPGRWFKLIGRESPVHRFTITDCVFAADAEPRSGWRGLGFPKDATFRGTNYVLWLGKPGEYHGEIPANIKFLEGQRAKEKWNEVRNQWLVAHGYDPRGPDDWDPRQAPVVAPRMSGTK